MRANIQSRSVVSNLLLFLSVLGLGLGLTYRIPWGKPRTFHESMRWRKLEYYDSHAGEFDVVFAGSSLVGQAVVPEIFDRVLAEYGLMIKSFNLGLPGDQAHHTEYLVRRKILRDDGRIPKYLVIDPRTIDLRADMRPPSRRDLIWNSPYETYIAVRSVLKSDRNSKQKRRRITPHIRTFLSKYLSITKGLNHMSDFLNPAELYPFHDDVAQMIDANHGYTSYSWHDDHDAVEFIRKRQLFLRDHSRKYFEQLNNLRELQSVPPPEGGLRINRIFFMDQVERIESFDIQLSYVTLPSITDFRIIDRLSEEPWFPSYLQFHSSDATGWGYDLSLRFDGMHLNDEAAAEFTERLARRFAAEISVVLANGRGID